MRIDNLEKCLNDELNFDIYRTDNYREVSSNGFKLSIQGSKIEHGKFLYERLIDLLEETETPYKLATIGRFDNPHPEQSKKAMTIYVRDDWDVKDFAEEVYKRIMDYNGWYNIPTPTSYQHYAGGVYYRNDRDENGQYIIAN